MAYAEDLKSSDRKVMRVRVPPRAPVSSSPPCKSCALAVTSPTHPARKIPAAAKNAERDLK